MTDNNDNIDNGIDDDMSDIDIEDYIDVEFNEEDEKVKKNLDDDEDEDLDLDDDVDGSILKTQFELEQKESNNDIVHIVPSNQRMTSEKMTSYEVAEVINFRAVNISQGAPVYTNVDGLTDPIDMAKKELIDRKCPLYIKRPVGHNEHGILVEKWSCNEMIFDVKMDE